MNISEFSSRPGASWSPVLAALAFGYVRERRLAPMPLFTAILVLIFGGLTLYLKNDIFIKMKPTVLYTLFGSLLLGGLAFNQLLIKYVFAQAFDLSDAGWRDADLAMGRIFSGIAALNEIHLAKFFHLHMGLLQGMGDHSADFSFCPGANATDPEARSAGGRRKIGSPIRRSPHELSCRRRFTRP